MQIRLALSTGEGMIRVGGLKRALGEVSFPSRDDAAEDAQEN